MRTKFDIYEFAIFSYIFCLQIIYLLEYLYDIIKQ